MIFVTFWPASPKCRLLTSDRGDLVGMHVGDGTLESCARQEGLLGSRAHELGRHFGVPLHVVTSYGGRPATPRLLVQVRKFVFTIRLPSVSTLAVKRSRSP